jgi:8-oxo-dGTP pyrophosphatase MutT (NUDIX family)
LSYPIWFNSLVEKLPTIQRSDLSSIPVPDEPTREAAVLVLFSEGTSAGEVIIIERASHLKAHPGQPAFPGGRIEEGDSSLAQTALREAKEEIGLDPKTIDVIGELPQLWIPPSNFKVTPVIGWWREPHPITQIDANEVAKVHQIPIADLVNPTNRTKVRNNRGWLGSGFFVADMLVWGFTGGLLSQLLDIAGWSEPWDETRIVDLPATEWSTDVTS